MNKRDAVLELIDGANAQRYIPAAFFLHFDAAYHQGNAAIEKHREFFRYTGMDFVKIQYEQSPDSLRIEQPNDWLKAPRYTAEFFAPTLHTVAGLVQAAKPEALVILTVYSPFMWLKHHDENVNLAQHFLEHSAAINQALEIMTDNVLTLVRASKRLGVDGFYVSSQGGEAFRFPGTAIFQKYIKPSDLAIWSEIQDCTFNILHICDYEGGYDDLSPFLDYPGHIVNCSLAVGNRIWLPSEAAQYFGRPFMGGMERKGIIATGRTDEIRQAADRVLAHAPERFVLAADCTVPSETPWENLRTAIDAAHNYRK